MSGMSIAAAKRPVAYVANGSSADSAQVNNLETVTSESRKT